jgi:hypothetical protein
MALAMAFFQSLAGLVHVPDGDCPYHCLVKNLQQGNIVVIIIIHNIRSRVIFAIKYSPSSELYIINGLAFSCCT